MNNSLEGEMGFYEAWWMVVESPNALGLEDCHCIACRIGRCNGGEE